MRQIKIVDFQEHAKAVENVLSVFPTLQIVGCAVTDLDPDFNLAILHSMYSNKESGFKAQGILVYPIILSVNTKILEPGS